MVPESIAIVLPDLRSGGAERVAVNLANGFTRRGYAVEMVLLSATGTFLADLHPGIRVVDLQVLRLRGALLPLARYLRRRRPDALLAFMWPLTVIALWARWLAGTGTRVVVAEHTTWSRDEIVSKALARWQVCATMHFSFPSADKVVAVSKGAADDLARFAHLNRTAISVIYNPIVCSTKPFNIKPRKDIYQKLDGWWYGKHRRILAVGTLKQIKDYPTLLAAFAKLRQQIDARLLILGEGECRAQLEEQVKQLDIGGSVFMPGFIKDISPIYKHAELQVLSSTGEGFGNVIVEALEAGTPVVSTDCPSGPREILSDGQFGRLVPVGDAAALADAMTESLSALHDTAALKARAQVFSIEKAVDQYEAMLFPLSKSKENL